MKWFVPLLVLFFCSPVAHGAAPKTSGGSTIVIDAITGAVLLERTADVRRPVASTQKLLTALIIAERGDLEDTVTVQPADADVEPTKVGIRPGDTYTRRQLLEALLVKSGNDTALALAREHSGSIEAFSEEMNRRAWSLGAINSRFFNPNGLPNEKQFSTARDMARIARAVYANPTLRSIVSLKKIDFQYTSGRVAELMNTNRVLRNWPLCNGMKTGYTNASGHCLVSSASWHGRDVITVVLGSDKAHIWNDSTNLLRWALEDEAK